ncbi:inner arm dynein 3-2 [Selaginella moellendorffii]|uniref:Inner arm dynein 3-2 n=1 Tax=Selaginella moellendorffii TaxID=88036 RepID=D8RG99_SELML|nr:inner arm dynein 3-2 [Selaginella moellendorffii]
MVKQWREGPVASLKAPEVQGKTDEYAKEAYKMGKANKEDTVVFRLKDAIDDFKQLLPLIEELANPALKDRHWTQIFKQVGQEYKDGLVFSINDMLDYKIMDKIEEVKGVASKEFSFQRTLDKMEKDWEGVEFIVLPYKDSGTFILGGLDDIQTILDDQLVKIMSMCASPFIKIFEGRAVRWKTLMINMQDLLDNWVECQATWQYLGPIFGSKDIMRQMPEEGEKFQTVDATWRDVMKRTVAAPGCIETAVDVERLEKLKEANRLLEIINKGLASYLEVKRVAFPRFFFLSNDEMLEILSETKDPLRVQPHLKKCFEGIDTLRFEHNMDVTGMISAEGEVVPLVEKFNPKAAQGAVEKWLLQVEEGMLQSLQEQCSSSVISYAETVREKWVLEWPGQIVLVVSAIYWTTMVTESILAGGNAVRECEKACTEQLGRIVNLVRGNLTKLNRATLSALVVMDVHARDVVTILANAKVEKETDFLWQSQLRIYWEKDTCFVRMMNAGVEYGYEYLGNSSRLVITPLTDRCYRTLMGAIHLNMGGAPEGPAGTGKTETTKDLAKALARQCVVFNCSDSLDYLAMAKFFKGLAAAGAWACFDEFNRIDLEVLSVVAQQVLEVQLAVQNKVKTFVFEGTELTLKPTCNVFITMNPGYAGRSELPDNLKALFRTVAMMVPDYAMISEIMLYSSGYLLARDCARKIVATYRLCSEQLSSQDHYDYGMRAVMAVLRAASNLKQRYPDEEEFILMLRSIIDVNLCKFLSQDVPLFNGIVSDLFPGVVLPEPDYTNLDKVIRDNCKKFNLQPTPYFKIKIIQLYEMIIVRHGLMLVGLSFSGKTCALRVLQAALTDLAEQGLDNERRVQIATVNPKSVTMGQLYGQADPMTQEWLDGVLAVRFREQASDPSNDRKWLVLDGPVDAIWIENMNTVLDDNKKLCLPNSEIIQMSSSMNMIFEVGDLAVASPATVSRCGMVYLEPHQMGWQPLMLSWLDTLPASLQGPIRTHLQGLFEWMVTACLRFVRKSVKELSPTSDANIVVSLMRNFYGLIDELKPEEAGKAFGKEKLGIWVDSIFLFSLVWSIGATGDNEARQGFDAFLRQLAAGEVPEGYELWVPSTHVDLFTKIMPDDDGATVYDFLFDKENAAWLLWTATIVPLEIPQGAIFSEIIIPTKDMVRYTFLLDKGIQANYPVLLVGSTGTGKSVYINRHLSLGLPKEFFTTIFVCFSARTSANMTQNQIDGQLDRRKRGIYGPVLGKRCIIFVDDLNMPQPEVYGAQPPIELLRQYMDHDGWYGRDNVFRKIVDVLFVAGMGPPGGGRNFVTQRFLRHFNVVGVAQVAEDSLRLIFNTILNWHLTINNEFPKDVIYLQPAVINATMDVFNESKAQLLPTPTKSHYTFNLRDYAKVIQGMMLQDSSKVPVGREGARQHVRLWVHEVLRVFYDRLVDDQDRDWLLKYLKELVQTRFKQQFDELFGHLLGENELEIGQNEMRRCFFGVYMNEDVESRVYEEITDVPEIISLMENYLTDYNGVSKRPMNLAIFLFAVEHVSRICRVLRQPGGHMLLVGVGGSGRQSLTRLGASVSAMEVFQVEISKSYTKVEWREDLISFLKKAGAAPGLPSVFLFSDTQITDEGFVEDLNNLLNSGEVPNMFPSDEKAQVLEATKEKAAKLGKELDSPMEQWRYFVEQCRQKLHVIFCMSPVGQAFRDRLRQFPSLVNCCTIDWFQEWPVDALEAVAYKFLKDMPLEDKARASIVKICKAFHENVREYSLQYKLKQGRHNYVTPTSYLELISTFQTLLQTKQEEKLKQKRRYEVGLEKLQSSAEQVAVMQQELQDLMPKLIVTVEEVEKLMAKVEREKKEVVEPKKAIVMKDEAEASKQAAEAKGIKDECEAVLAVAMPVLEEALAALDTLSANDINYVKKLSNPPAAVKLVMEAVCVILDVKPAKIPDGKGGTLMDYWKPSVVLLNNKDFLQNLKDYDKDNIEAKIIAKIRSQYTSNPEFTPAKAANASAAAEGLCKWIIAMDKYDTVAKFVAPKKAKLREAEGKYEVVMVGLRAKQTELKGLLDKLGQLEEELDANMLKKENLQHEVKMCTVKLERAEQLIGGLGGEKTRWIAAAKQLGIEYVNLTGDVLVASGIIAYLGAFTAGYRIEIVDLWTKLVRSENIPRSTSFSFFDILGNPVHVREWMIAGLPNDSFSIENGIIVANSRRWPLMIDPQGQANKWIRNMERERNLQIIKLLGGGDYMRILENAIQFGLPVLLENVGEELDPSLEPLLLRQIFKSGGMMCIKLGDTVIEYNNDFRFYITTKYRNPHYLPETAVKVTLLNFMITKDGLSDQLLGVVVAKERPDLEQQKNELVVQGAENKRRLKELEDKILEVLSSSEGNILEDETAVKIISEAKVVGNDITVKQTLAEQTEKNIDEARKGYQSCGEYAAILFFCITDLANIDPMYQYSLPWFSSLFVISIASSEKNPDLIKRLEIIQDFFLYVLYNNVCRSLFEKDKLLFSCLLASRILEMKGEISVPEWMFFLTGGVASSPDRPNPAPEWLLDKAWGELCRVSKFPAFADLSDHVIANTAAWKAMFSSPEPHMERIPGKYDDVTSFQKLLVLHCIRPDKVIPGIQRFVTEKLGEEFVQPPQFNLASCYKDSSATCPLIFVLSPGSDPTAALLKFAGDMEMGDRLAPISLGQGQGPKAATMITDAMATAGSWVLLQNCHLAPSWMPELERICENVPAEVHQDFRLWMTSYPSPKFPITVLQNGVKMTNEPPKGLRANMRRSYGLDPISNEEFFESSNQPEVFKGLLFGLTFFHAVVQERRNFGPLGWNIPYGFDDGDLRISVRQLHMFINESTPGQLPLEALRYVTGECNYGGRVTDDKDRLLLNTILRTVYCPEMPQPGYKLSESGIYQTPEPGNWESYAKTIDTFPIIPGPEVFGLHTNADITKDMNATALILSSLLATSAAMVSAGGGGGGGDGGGGEGGVAVVVREILRILPPNFDIEACERKYPVLYEESMNTVLSQEMTRFNKLLDRIRGSLINMEKAIRGVVVMSAELETAYKSMMINQVPALWQKVSYPSLKPLSSYITDLMERLHYLQDWYDHGVPAVHWVSGFFFAQSFLTAAMQNYARKHRYAIDTLGFDYFVVDGEPTQAPREGVYIKGLYLEGCAWDPVNKCLCESQPKVIFVPAPIIWLKPVLQSDMRDFNHYNCPVYRTMERRGVLATTGHSTNFLMYLKMPSKEPADHWIRRGVAMLCSLSD